MSEPVFYLQIVDKDGVIARFPGGGKLESDLIDLCTKEIIGRPVGVFRTTAVVERAIRDGLKDAIMSLKAHTRRLVGDF
jgi:hypothetical protein